VAEIGALEALLIMVGRRIVLIGRTFVETFEYLILLIVISLSSSFVLRERSISVEIVNCWCTIQHLICDQHKLELDRLQSYCRI